jgi:transposase
MYRPRFGSGRVLRLRVKDKHADWLRGLARDVNTVVCGAIHDRDVNAAHNILAGGHRRLAEGILAT